MYIGNIETQGEIVMTGEMIRSEVTREAYPLHFAIADEFGGSVEPFDQYQGPYVVIGSDIRVGEEPYQVAVLGHGIVRLWFIQDENGECTIFNEANDLTSVPFLWEDVSGAIAAARSILN
jgi:hypothetical protein